MATESVRRYGGINGQELDAVRVVLAACDLPSADLDPQALRYFIGAWEDETLVGVIGLQPLDHAALLRSLAVLPSHRGAGVGARLCDEAESLARAGNLTDLYLLTIDAAPYFAAHGYRPCPRDTLPAAVRATAQFRALCPASAVAMHKHLEG
jgi:N-acetylglutamate synthase-like GNAT family acetyltransferase